MKDNLYGNPISGFKAWSDKQVDQARKAQQKSKDNKHREETIPTWGQFQ